MTTPARAAAIALTLLAWVLAVAATPSPSPLTTARPSPPPSPVAVPSPSATPTPSSGQVNLSPVSGPPATTVTVVGSQFRPLEAISIYWDNRDKPLGSATADALGSFRTEAQTPDDVAGAHVICVLEPAPVCAGFQLQAKSSPTATAATPAASSLPTPPAATPGTPPTPPPSGRFSAISVLLQPPLVFLPILLFVGLVGLAVMWIRSGSQPRTEVLQATVTHRRQPPAQPDRLDPTPSPAAGAAGAPAPDPASPAPPAAPPTGARGDDSPPDLPEPSD